MRLTREKINLLSHQIAEKLASIDEVEFIEDRNTIRLAVVETHAKEEPELPLQKRTSRKYGSARLTLFEHP